MSIELFNMDCLEGMKNYPDKYFNLSIVDPPYGIGEDGRNNHTRGCFAKAKDYRGNAEYDNNIPDENYFIELRRVSKHQIIWGGNYFIEHLDATPCFIVWDKDNGETDFADCELAWTSFDTAVRKFKHKWQGMLQENMKDKEQRIHPNHKPVRLYKWLLTNYAKPGDKILDTHGGSMSIALACHQLKFDLTLFEIDKDYFEAGKKRLKDFQMQGELW